MDSPACEWPDRAQGGEGEPLVLVHGLMGRGSTWPRQLPWLTRLGQVYTYDAPWHRGPRRRGSVSDQHRAVRRRPRRRGRVAGLARPSWSVTRWARCTRGVWRRAGPSWSVRSSSRTWRRTSAAAPPARGSRGCMRLPVEFDYGPKDLRRVRARRRAVLPRGVRPDRDRLAAARPPEDLDRDRRRVGHPRLLAVSGHWCGRRAADRGGQLGHPPGADAQNGGNRLPDYVFARARRRSPDPRRRAADLPARRSSRS